MTTDPSQAEFSNSEDTPLKKLLRTHGGRGGQVGQVLLTWCQLKLHRLEPSLRLAIKLQVQTLLPPYKQAVGSDWYPEAHLEQLPRNRGHILENVRYYGRAIHLWAAYAHAEQTRVRPEASEVPAWIFTEHGLHQFLRYAEEFWNIANAGKPPKGTGSSFLTKIDRWIVRVPSSMTIRTRVEAKPISPEWEAVISTARKRKH